jgi:hypothetical protein
MPFDGSHFDPPPSRPKKPDPVERTVLIFVAVIAILLLLLPVPFAALGDIVAYLSHSH